MQVQTLISFEVFSLDNGNYVYTPAFIRGRSHLYTVINTTLEETIIQ